MDQKGLRAQSLKEIKGVQWIPDWGRARIESMVANRPDWCISRQRTWGVPMSLFVHKDTEELHPRAIELMEEVAKRVEVDGIRRGGISIRKISSATKLTSMSKSRIRWTCGSTPVQPTHPSWMCVLSLQGHAADMYLEGSDQHRGWFMSS